MISLAKLGKTLGLLGIMLGGTQAILADPAGGWLSPNGTRSGNGTTSPASPAGPAGTSPTSGPDQTQGAQVGVSTNVSLVDLQGRARLLHEQMRADTRHVQHLQQIARKAKDVIKLNCVNDKLVQVKPQMNIADIGEAELEASNDANRTAAFETLAQAAESIRRLREEADQCIGEPITQGGDSSNSFTSPDVPDDPSKGFDGPVVIEAPGYASPFD
jgi:hypothetical protein